ncbi:Fatty acid desaturase [Pirellulimonas nuda]|uniref:Fatty acid desaturase n=1 Tax=Pirellulimonas nuda TaxID=2528009 RepID=A0A518DFQ3_9BACT|nr:fatty acid desaturase [Pirellulimonas nuda]QDU90262.1 Fatty acid desaturase [Pirellulimonas nuda]
MPTSPSVDEPRSPGDTSSVAVKSIAVPEAPVDSWDLPPQEDGRKPGQLRRPPTVMNKMFLVYLNAFIALHLLSLLAFFPYFFSWAGVIACVLGYYLIGAVGINLCYHRQLTHRSLITPKWLEHTMAICGVCCLQDAPARWVAIHRIHHRHSDNEEDPHSPMVSFLWGHVEWLVWQNKYFGTSDFYDRYARDLLKDPFYMKLERNLMWFWVYAAHAVAFYVLGFLGGWAWSGTVAEGVRMGWSMFIWGVCLRTVLVWHVTWSVNSLSHLFGYRNYDTRDQSTNNWLVALLTSGEGWHNNHHAHPRCAAHGHRWWELDFTYWTIRFLESVGLAKEVVHQNRNRTS